MKVGTAIQLGWFVTTLMLLAATGSQNCHAQSSATGLTAAELQLRLKHAQSDTEMDPKLKQEVIGLYQSAIQQFELADDAIAAAKKYKARLDSIAVDLQKTKQHLEALPEQPSFSLASGEDVDALEQKLDERRKLVDDPEHGLRARADGVKNELAAKKSRLEEISRNLVEVEEHLATIQEQLDSPVPGDQPHELTLARQTLLHIRRSRAAMERTALQTEQDWCESDDATNLLRIHHEIAVRELAAAEAEVQFLEREVDRLRGSEADQRVRAAEEAVTQAPPRAKPVAEVNRRLAVECRDVAAKLHETNQRVDSARENFATLKAEFDQSRKMVDAVGLTESIGLLLRRQRTKLTDTRGLHSRLVLRGETVRQTKMRLFELEAEMASLSDLDVAALATARELLGDDAPSTNSGEALPKKITKAVRQLAEQIKPLLQQQRELLDRLNDDYNIQFEKLVLLDNDERKLLDATQNYIAYIDERVLWIRTGTVFGSAQVVRAAGVFTWLIDHSNWVKVADALATNFHREPLPYAFALAAGLFWIGLWWTMHRRLRTLGTIAADESCHEMHPTLQALVLTGLLSALLPALMGFVGWRLDHCASTSKFAHAVGIGLLRMAMFAAPLELLRRVVSHGGLAEQHFGWSRLTVTRLRRHGNWFTAVGILLVGVIGLLESWADEQRLDSLGRLAFLIFASFLSLFCLRAFPRRAGLAHPGHPNHLPDRHAAAQIAPQDRSEAPEDAVDLWTQRLIGIGMFLVVTFPLALLILGWSGYFYTALQLTWRLQASAWLALGIMLLRETIRRWITLERRRMAILQAEELQAIADAGRQPVTDDPSPFLFPRWTWPDFRLNLTQIVTQVRSLLDTGLLTLAAVGLWLVWADVTPALNVLDRVPLWHTTVEEVIQTRGADDKPVVQAVKRPVAITASHLGLALLTLAIAAVASRNVPGLVEVVLLEHLSVDAGVRFATTCLVRYIIFITGVCLSFHQIGIGWNSVQWLVAAASVGLGFGLQEIFANFVSGIILLFERPMRVGDVITVGSTTGTVSKIRFRATTIVDGDRKELIVPNKSFITDNLLNWTLSDSINRVAIKVTVGYGVNPERVRSLLLKIAFEHPSLLRDPAPTATLEELGDNSLVFHLRAFLPNLKDRQKVMHDLNATIHNALGKAGILIPSGHQQVSDDVCNADPRRDLPATDLHESLESALHRAGVKI